MSVAAAHQTNTAGVVVRVILTWPPEAARLNAVIREALEAAKGKW